MFNLTTVILIVFLQIGTLIPISTPQDLAVWMWTIDSDNERPIMVRHDGLQKAADYKAKYLYYNYDKIPHCMSTEKDNYYCPNEMIKDFGCNTTYPDNYNYIESLAKGTRYLPDIFKFFKQSPAHEPHINGKTLFHNGQTDIAVGNYEDVWVFLSATCI